ncbi:23S rRNA m(2)G-2445 methyltransferase [Candidatus Electrothrix aarhusensis]|uniref:Ribosomal RNA large subunit methyltransferase K/L n=1 Tax=Candidatus Electrothrix aarhusensis TaxID=1859131 RepID=A0A444IQJ2_9BACT|nr:23S rRNA m(2)G-2445 methyltransferase [Candidatus Electrothrix aarhusensis]
MHAHGITGRSVRSKRRRNTKEPYCFVATCAAGLENLVQEEISLLGGLEPVTAPGAVTWQANSLKTAYLACLWSRFSSRILLRLTQFEAPTPDELYKEASKIDWGRHFNGDTSFAISTTLVNSGPEMNHSHYASLRIKDAIVDQFRRRTGERPDVDVRTPGIRLNLHVEGTAAALSLDLSGESLHRRGYRTGAGEAPLKETLAAAIAYLSGVRVGMSPDTCILDPMCGSATLLIEAALIVGDSAPGLLRDTFGFQHWLGHNEKMWETLVEAAVQREDQHAETPWPMIIGYDADPHVVAAARKNIINAGLGDRITIKQRQLARLHPPTAEGILVTNPPYGERLSEKEAVKYLYRAVGRIFRQHFSGWQLGFFTANPDFADMLGVSWQERHRLYNGPLKCRLLTTALTAASPGASEEFDKGIRLSLQETPQANDQESDPALPAEDFANRLRKNCQRLFPWAEEHNITCFRIYDADIPEYNVAIDVYEQWVHVQEYEPPATVPSEKAEERFNQALQVIRQLLDVPHSQLFVKKRRKQRGNEQYQKRPDTTGKTDGKTGKLYEVREGGNRFLVNFTDYLDTGLFLDHRKTRALLAELADGRTFLNLFAYTGSATVYAAKGGAVSTQTVDLSEKYLVRAQANLSLNGFGGALHQFSEADCLQWLKSCRDQYGVIFVDPPTFSNSRHKNIVFDVQKDHPELLRLAMNLLTHDGVLVFSTNYRKFELDTELEEEFVVREITNQTLPEDFQGKGNIHRCWRFRHHNDEE